jgi:hypothetical protein
MFGMENAKRNKLATLWRGFCDLMPIAAKTQQTD